MLSGLLKRIRERNVQIVLLVFAAGLFFVFLGWVVSARYFEIRLTLDLSLIHI